jgi:hypothetical protein
MGPFDTIESAQQYIHLLVSEVADARRDIQTDTTASSAFEASRRLAALQLADYKLQQLAAHLGESLRILNDLRMIRRLLIKDGTEAALLSPLGVGT